VQNPPSVPLSNPPQESDAAWYRFAFLLTGDAAAACEILRAIFLVAPDELAQIRSRERQKIWLIRKIRAHALKWRLEHTSATGEGDASVFLAGRVSALPEPARSAFALFHCLEGNLEEFAEQLGLGTAAFSDALAKARQTLAPGSVFPENVALRMHRPWGQDRPNVAKAVQAAQDKPELAAQIAADRQWHEEIGQIPLPEELALLHPAKPPRQGFLALIRQPAVLAIALALLVIVGVVVYLTQTRMGDFPGKETIEALVEDAATISESDFEHIPPTEAGKLGDWFVMNGFEGFAVPPELEAAKADGCRVYKHDGIQVGGVTLEKQKALLLVVRAADVKPVVPPGSRHQFQVDEWAVEVRADPQNVCVLMFQGDSEDIPTLLKSLGK